MEQAAQGAGGIPGKVLKRHIDVIRFSSDHSSGSSGLMVGLDNLTNLFQN